MKILSTVLRLAVASAVLAATAVELGAQPATALGAVALPVYAL